MGIYGMNAWLCELALTKNADNIDRNSDFWSNSLFWGTMINSILRFNMVAKHQSEMSIKSEKSRLNS
jgi:hypothetical protein